MSWFSKDKAAPVSDARKPGVHVSHDLHVLIEDFLCSHGRLQKRRGKHLLHFSATSKNHDGSVDFLVRTRVHHPHGQEQEFDSHIRVYADRRLKLIR
jgi:hypothetical protein